MFQRPKKNRTYSFLSGSDNDDGPSDSEGVSRKTMIGSAVVCLVIMVFVLKQLLSSLYTDDEATLSIKFKNDYPKLTSLSYYSWDNVVEPNVETTLSIGLYSSDSNCEWKIYSAGTLVNVYSGCGDIKHTFTSVSTIYTVKVLYNGGTTIVSEEAVCKYVRREIRALTSYDRTTYFSALELIHRLSLEEGQAQFGSNFKNYEYFTLKHLDAWTDNDCFPYVGPFHGSNAFLTTHAAFTLELEQSLQSIDPSLSQPYWDFTVRKREPLFDFAF
jgi:hypothetical protein